MKKKKFIAFFLLISLIPLYTGALPVEESIFSEWSLSSSIWVFTDGIPELIEINTENSDNLVPLLGGIPERDFKPWTMQLRTAGFVGVSTGAFIAVNGGYPVLFKPGTGKLVSPDRKLAEEFLLKTAGLTIGSLYAGERGAGIHLYRDKFFNQTDKASTDMIPVVIEVSTGALDIFSLEIPEYRFALENPDWEPVEFIHKHDKNIIAWKYSDEKKSMFRYIVHSGTGAAVDEIDENYFRDEFELLPAESGPFALRGFVRAVREGAVGEKLQAAGDIFLRLTAGSGSESEAVYLSESTGHGNESVPVQLQACPDGETWYILDDDSIFVCDSNITVYELPKLPEEFEYTGIWTRDGYMLLSWEETRFMYTARSGVIMIRMRDILN